MMTAVMERTLLAPRPAPHAPRTPDRTTLPYRRLVYGVLVGALTMFAVATLDAFAGATVPVLGTIASLPGPGTVPAAIEVPAPPSQPGTCLSWARPDAADAAVVDCAQSHLFEQAGSVTLTDQPALPNDQQWRQLVKERCDPIVTSYLKGKLDPDGRYRIGALKPSAAKWSEGDRELRCGLQRSSQSGAMYPTSGKVADSDQSDVQQPGTCLAVDGRGVGDPTSCTGAHAVETVGVVDLAQKFDGDFPAVADQDAYLQPTCAQQAAGFAGGDKVITDKRLTVYWDNITEDSWKAGSRKVNCNLAALLPDRSGFAPVTGSVKGSVTVGDRPAPPAAETSTPGAPAPPTTSSAPPDSPAPTSPQSQTSAPATSATEPPSTTAPAILPTLPPELLPSTVITPRT
jgi:Septum formation